MGDGEGGRVTPVHKNDQVRNALFLAFIIQSFIDGSASLEEVHAAFIDVQEFPEDADTIVLAAERALAVVKAELEPITIPDN
jgi:hypothetical protein